ncbi:SDR family oxidoreductase [Streptomyces huiliensis]|uniref:SDR family oxidoreductase n=1 Tax=Streptomyces huiliensis TaxID=2876027 RepID=UPI001CBB2C2A|nr:SDR family oxidoreductase [Streptomyces huiliensis]MBZ4320499.1 SDR family oxidoreductase [Streptomyces huiliensis]
MTVLLTGGTGFLGLHLIRELLARHDRLTLLARAASPPALPRVARFLRHHGMPDHETRRLPERLRVVDGDVTAPRLGLPEPAFRRLADEADTVWHCAADISLDPAGSAVRTANTNGMRQVLALLDAGERAPRLVHSGSLAVAGAQEDGTVPETLLDGAHGFNSPYEESKFLCELLVHDWCTRRGRSAAVFRLPGLVTATPAYPGRPRGPLDVCTPLIHTMLRTLPEVVGPTGTVRLPGTRPDAVHNYLPVEHVARVMAESLDRAPSTGGMYLQHIAHQEGTPVSALLAAVTRGLGGSPTFVLDPEPPGTEAERTMHRRWVRYLPFMRQRRRYEVTRAAALGLAWPAGRPLDEAYLSSRPT